MEQKNVAVVLAAGRGKRMNSRTAKQFLLIKERPVLYYSLKVFEDCPFISEIVLVTGEQEIAFCRKEILERYGFQKVKHITAGGAERYHSVYNGLLAAGDCDYVYIHDGARPFVTREILERARRDVCAYQACAVGMPVKDTIKIADRNGFCESTPNRSLVWQVQTPQAFRFSLALEAYEKLMQTLQNGSQLQVTDDAMVVEAMTDVKVKLTEGSYANLKITTPEDLRLAEELAKGLEPVPKECGTADKKTRDNR